MIGLCVIPFNANLENVIDSGDYPNCVGESNNDLPAAKPDALF